MLKSKSCLEMRKMPERFENAPFTNENSSADPFQATDKFSEQDNGAGFDPLINPGQTFLDEQVNKFEGRFGPQTPGQFFYNNQTNLIWTGPFPSASVFDLVDDVDNFGGYVTSFSETQGFQPFS